MWIRMPSSLVQNKKRNEPIAEPQGSVYIKWLCRKQGAQNDTKSH